MRIIHCADIHLDSALSTNMIAMKAGERREELLRTWVSMVEYAKDNSVDVIIIAGDWFDTSNISLKTADIVSGTIKKYKEIDFLYLPGNHDEKACVDMLGKHANLKVFGVDGERFVYDRIVVSAYGRKMHLNEEDINIVVAHGDMPDIKVLAGMHIDYMALGHIHKYMEGGIDARGTWCYPGCLEPRGFDEAGKQGFVVLDVSHEGINRELIPSGYRHVHIIDVEVSYDSGENGMDTIMLCDVIADKLKQIPGKDMVKVRITGELFPGDVINTGYIYNYFKDKFYGFRIEDVTSLVLDIEAISKERSLKGEFIRAVMASQESDDVKRSIIRCGLSALTGEVIG